MVSGDLNCFHELVETMVIFNKQGSEALGSVGSQIGFVHVRMGAAICSLVYHYRTSTPPMHVHTL